MDILKKLNSEEDYTYPNWVAQQAERKEAADEIERLREVLKETLAVARRNEIGDYIQRAETALSSKGE